MSRERFVVLRCPECRSLTDPRGTPTLYCSGNQNGPEPLAPHQGDHPSTEMERLVVEVVEEPRKAGPEWTPVVGPDGSLGVVGDPERRL